MPWTTDDRSRFLDALLSAYSVAGFATMLKLSNDRDLADIVPPSAPRKQAFLDVIAEAERGGWIDGLVRGAHRDQPDNPDMKAFFRDYERRAPRSTGAGNLFHGLATDPQPRQLRLPRRRRDVASASPIVIAVEEHDHAIPYADLLPVERHVTVKLTDDDVRRLHDIGRADRPPQDALARLADDGVEVWRILRGRQRRLETVFERAGAAPLPQPIAWTGSGELLAKIHAAVLIARFGRSEELRDLLSIGAGDHYFNPLAPPGGHRNLPHRVSAGELDAPRPLVRSLDEVAVDAIQAAVAGAAMSPVVVVGAPSRAAAMAALSRAIAGASTSLCRIAVGLGDGDAALDALDDLIAQVPCVALGGATLCTGSLIQPLAEALVRDGGKLAAPSLIAIYRRAWVEQALERGDGLAVLDGLRWTTWSWIGLPLFADSFGEVVPAAHPHLLGLRAVSSIDWYYNRQSGIPDLYQADALARVSDEPGPAGDRFHLYLSGAGGTGKSCFLRYVYEKLAQRPEVLAVWYRVDAPTSGWPLVDARIKEEAVRAVASQLGDAGQRALPSTNLELGAFLLRLAANLRGATPVTEIVLFIDQLERTFESGDAPDPINLGQISQAIVRLLKDLNVGQAVRVFIASRKQYLPDFLRSYDHAEKSRLHFNVLQTIGETTEQQDFVRTILGFCARLGLVDDSLRIEDAAAAALAQNVSGHPLNLMLSLIQLFAEGPTGTITRQQLEARRPPPWENLFHFDLQLAAKDDLDWYFLLAMAAARTEIVRTEEVWWRLRLIDARLTRRADELNPHGMLERLWLLGHLGRTIHARPDGKDPAGFLEFFHANLRDHLLRDVMGTGGAQLGITGRSGGMPPVWRSLDRLAVAARDWTQTQQALPSDDLAVLMQHRDVVIKPFAIEGEAEPAPFALLFLRDARPMRRGLCLAAAECFVFSALVHDQLGRWAFEALFPDLAKRTARCTHWLGRSDRGSRLRILRYLVELGAPGEDTLAEIVLAPDVPEQPALWRELADVLAEPLYAARFRDRVVGACVERAAREPDRVRGGVRCRELIIAACDGRHGDIVTTLASLEDLAVRSSDDRVKQLVFALDTTALPAGRKDAPSVDIAASSPRDLDGEPAVPIQLVVHSASRAEAIERMVSAPGRQELIRRLGIPLPAIAVRTGERVAPASDPNAAEAVVPDDAIELRLAGQSVALGVFPLDRRQVLQRHWQRSGRPPPAGPPSFDDALGEVVSWVDPAELDGADPPPARRSDEALIDWLEEHVRRHADLFFDFDLLVELMREIAARIELRRLFETLGLPDLRRIVLDLVEERVPLSAHRFALIEKLQQLAGRIKDIDVLTQKLREAVAPALCRAFVGAGGQLALITLSERLEEQLATRLRATATGDEIGVTTAQAQDIVNAIRRLRERCLAEHDVLPVVVTVPVLRRPLFELCRGFDRRIFTLSLTELSPKVRFLVIGEIPALAVVGDG